MKDVFWWLAPIGSCLCVVFAFVFFVAVCVALDPDSEHDTVWPILGRWWRSYFRFCGEVARACTPTSKPRRSKPATRDLSIAFSRREFLAGRIDVDEYERRVERALKTESAA